MSTLPQSPRALVIDDDPDFIQLITVALKTLGIAVDAYQEVEPFLLHLKDHRPTFCLIDLHIGEVAVGFSVVKSIREVLGNEIPLIIASATTDPQAIAHAMELGADDYLTKPIHFSLLAAKMKNYISSRKIAALQPPFMTVPQSECSVGIELEVKILAIDELGVTLGSRHLLRKGLEIELACPEAKEYFGRDHISVRVASNSLDVSVEVNAAGDTIETSGYRTYCAYDPDDEKLFDDVRKWLAKKTG